MATPKIDRHVMIQADHHACGMEKYGNLAVSFIEPTEPAAWSRAGSTNAEGQQPSWPEQGEGTGVVLSAQISAMQYSDSNRVHCYAWTIGVDMRSSQFHPAGLEGTERAVKFAKKLQANCRRMAAKFGEPATFGQFVAFALEGMNVKTIWRERDATSYDDSRYHTMPTASTSIAYVVDRQVSEAEAYCQPAAAVA